jgi:hypothetical protein
MGRKARLAGGSDEGRDEVVDLIAVIEVVLHVGSVMAWEYPVRVLSLRSVSGGLMKAWQEGDTEAKVRVPHPP